MSFHLPSSYLLPLFEAIAFITESPAPSGRGGGQSIQLVSMVIPTVLLKLVAQHLVGITTDIPLAISAAIVIIYAVSFTILAIRQRLSLE